jgi:hypothetical protein
MTFGTVIFPPHHNLRYQCADLPTHTSHCLDRLFHQSASFPSCVPPSLITDYGGTGISTCCPSTTPFGLALGPDLPWADEPTPGTLRLSADRILTCLFVTHTGILTSVQSTSPYGLTSTRTQRSPTQDIQSMSSHSFGGVFSPVTFSAQSHSTSELLRTL